MSGPTRLKAIAAGVFVGMPISMVISSITAYAYIADLLAVSEDNFKFVIFASWLLGALASTRLTSSARKFPVTSFIGSVGATAGVVASAVLLFRDRLGASLSWPLA